MRNTHIRLCLRASTWLICFWHFWVELVDKLMVSSFKLARVFSAFMHWNQVCCFKTNQTREIIDILPSACVVSALAQALFNVRLICEQTWHTDTTIHLNKHTELCSNWKCWRRKTFWFMLSCVSGRKSGALRVSEAALKWIELGVIIIYLLHRLSCCKPVLFLL